MHSTNVKVQRALRLWAIGAITLQMVKNARAGKGRKQLTLPKTWVLKDGTKESTLFNDATWGDVSRTRMDFINNNLRESSLTKAVLRAKEFTGSYQDRDMAKVPENEDVQMVDLSDGECTHI
jgi:hypothetical protein